MLEVGKLIYQRRGFFLDLFGQHIFISFVSIVIAIILGGLIGIYISEYQRSSKVVLSTINFLYTIPSISMLGFLIPFSGIGNVTAIIALSIYALLPMVRSTYTGMTNIDPEIIEAARGMGSTDFQILKRIKFPLALPIILSGIRNMIVMTIALAGIASFIGAGGLGIAIYRGITTNNTTMTVAGSLLIALLALVTDFLFGCFEKRILNKHAHHSKKRSKPIWVALTGIIAAGAIGITAYQMTRPKTIHIATKPMTEQYILGEMLTLLIENETDLKVQMTQGVGGGTSNIQPAMEKGKFDLYPEYTGTAWNMVLKNKKLYSEKQFKQLQSAYQSQYQMQWVGMYGFKNSYALAVRKEIAQRYHLKKISDLQAIAPQLSFGAEYDFYEREDGYTPLCRTYQLNFKDTTDLDIGLKYKALNQKEIDVMPIFTTDGQSTTADLVVLEDDKHFYPSYECGNVVRTATLKKYPELKKVLHQVDHLLTDQEMAKLNYQVEEQKKSPKEVAKHFLKAKGLLEAGGAKHGQSDD